MARMERLRRGGLATHNFALVALADDLIIRYEELAFRIEHGYACPTGHANGANGHGALLPPSL